MLIVACQSLPVGSTQQVALLLKPHQVCLSRYVVGAEPAAFAPYFGTLFEFRLREHPAQYESGIIHVGTCREYACRLQVGISVYRVYVDVALGSPFGKRTSRNVTLRS